MTSLFEFREGRKDHSDTLVEFTPRAKPKVEHVDSSTIVEKLELTDELRAEFEAAGYTIDEDQVNAERS